MRKKILATTAMAAVAVLALSGCATGGETASEAPANSRSTFPTSPCRRNSATTRAR